MRHPSSIAATRTALAVVLLISVLTGCASAADRAEDDPTPLPSASTAADGRADFDGDGFGDLAVHKTDASFSTAEWGGSLGMVQVLYGTSTGFRIEGGQQWVRADFDGKRERDPDAFGFALTHGDFDADGFSDLVIGDPGATEDGWGRGDVRVLFGSATGLTTERMQTWTLDSPGLGLQAAVGDGFGRSLTVGRLGRGGALDLAIGIPGRSGLGATLILFGGSSGLTADGYQVWRQGQDGLPGTGQRGDDFGSTLITGDFDADGADELVIGARYDTVDGVLGAGSVHVLHGSADGPTAAGSQQWAVGQNGLSGTPGEADLFGDTLAAGRFSDSDHLDLAIGMPGWGGGLGAVRVLYGTADGLSARGHQVWDEYRLGTRDHGPDDSESEDSPRLGAALVTADFGRGEQDDLVIGVPESLSPGFGSGAIQILYGTASGLASEGARQISQVTPGIQGFDNDEALFGTALAVLRPATSTAYPTLAVAAPWYGGKDDRDRSGMINLIRGSAEGLTASGDATLRPQQFPQRPVGDGFGWVMTS